MEFSHYSENGRSGMVDVTSKDDTSREARAKGFVSMSPETLDLIEQDLLPKGNPFEVARIAGIQAAKMTSRLIPMCHPLLLTWIDVTCTEDREKGGIFIQSEVHLKGQTGVEMEALTAVSVAALTVYDMCKAVDKKMVIEGIEVIEKRGGKMDYKKS